MSVTHIVTSRLPTSFGTFAIHGFADTNGGKEHLALTMGKLEGQTNLLTRLHSECLTGETLFSMRCDCGSQLNEALKRIAEQRQGILLYLRQEGRGIGLLNKLKAYNLQDQGADTVEANIKLGFEADERSYDMVKYMLNHLGVKSVCLMTNNLGKMKALMDLGIAVDGREAIQVGKNIHNQDYLITKARKMQHVLD